MWARLARRRGIGEEPVSERPSSAITSPKPGRPWAGGRIVYSSTGGHRFRRSRMWLVRWGTRGPENAAGSGGHGEGLWRSHGDGVGGITGYGLVERSTVNAGTLPWVPFRAGQPARGVREGPSLTDAGGRGAELVVVGVRESRSQDEGAQCDCAAIRCM